MNQQLNFRSDQHGDFNWATKSWDSFNGHGEVEIGPYQGSRVDRCDWENPVIVKQNVPRGAAGECSHHGFEDHKPQFLSDFNMTPTMNPCNGLLLTNFGSAFHHSNIELLEPIGIQPFGGIDHSLPNPPLPIPENFGFSNSPGLPAANISQIIDLRFSDQQHRNRLLGSLCTDLKACPSDFIKPNDMYYEDSHARLGLNLGFRTYFSSEDTIAGRLGKRSRANSPGSLQVQACQAQGCKADLSHAKHYHRRHKVCELHSKAAIVVTNGQNQRFCQQCSRFQPLSEFDEGKRSCRKRLADHNRRRRKPQPTASSSTTAEPLPLKAEERQEHPTKSDSPGAAEENSVKENHKKGGSPSVSVENSGSKTTSVGDKAHNPPADQSSPSQLFSSLSPTLVASDQKESFLVSQPTSLLIRSDNGSKDSKQGSSSQPHGLIRSTGLTLSSAAIREGQLVNNCRRESISSDNYDIAAINSFPWLKHNTPNAKLADHLTSSAARSHDEIIPGRNSLNSMATIRSAECELALQAVCPSIQNLLPFQSSKDNVEHSDWILKNLTRKTKPQSQSESSQFKPSTLNCQSSFENSQGLRLFNCPSIIADAEVQLSSAAQGSSQKNYTIGSLKSGKGGDAGGQVAELKFPELQTIRQFGSIYDPNINFLQPTDY